MNNPKKQPNKWLVFMNIPFQMGVLIFGSVFGGLKMDDYFKTAPLFLIVFSLGSIVLSFISILKQLKRLDNKDE